MKKIIPFSVLFLAAAGISSAQGNPSADLSLDSLLIARRYALPAGMEHRQSSIPQAGRLTVADRVAVLMIAVTTRRFS